MKLSYNLLTSAVLVSLFILSGGSTTGLCQSSFDLSASLRAQTLSSFEYIPYRWEAWIVRESTLQLDLDTTREDTTAYFVVAGRDRPLTITGMTYLSLEVMQSIIGSGSGSKQCNFVTPNDCYVPWPCQWTNLVEKKAECISGTSSCALYNWMEICWFQCPFQEGHVLSGYVGCND